MTQIPFDKRSEQSYPPLFTLDALGVHLYFLSFNKYWLIFVAFCNLLGFYAIIFYLCLNAKAVLTLYIIEGMCFLVAVFDLILSIMHVIFKSASSYHCYQPVSIFYMTGMVALLLAALVTAVMPKTTSLIKWLHLSFTATRGLFKAGQIIWYFLQSGEVIDILTGATCAIMIISNITVVQWFAAWWNMQCPNCASSYITDRNVELSTWDTFIISFFFGLCGVTNVGYGGGPLSEMHELIIIIMLSLISLGMLRGTTYVAMTMLRINAFSLDDLAETHSITIRKNLVREKIYPKELINKKLEHFCLKYLPKLIGRQEPILLSHLPLAIRQDMWKNIYRMIFRYSFVFKNMPTEMKHVMIDAITTESYSFGEKLYDANIVADKMMFIAEGNVRVMAPDDEDNPLVQLCVGTCFGASFLFYPRKPGVSLYAVNFCTTHTISFTDFWKKINLLRPIQDEQIFLLHKSFKDKLCSARRDVEYRKRFKLPLVSTTEIKSNLPSEMLIWSLQHDLHVKGTYFLSTTNMRVKDHTFLKTSCIIRFRPGSYLLKYWTWYMIGLIILVMLEYPFFVTFEQPIMDFSIMFLALQLLIVISYPLDLFIECTTATTSERGYETDLGMIFRNNISSWIFIVDIIAAIPVSFVFYIMKNTGYLKMHMALYNILQLQVVIKSLKLPYYYRLLGRQLHTRESVKVFVYLLYFNYVWACIYYTIFDETNTSSWLSEIPPQVPPLQRMFIIFTYFLAVSTLANCYHMTHITEIYFVLGLTLFGIVYYIYFLSYVTSSMIITSKSKTEYYNRIEFMKKYLTSMNVSSATQNSLNNFLAHQWDYYFGISEHNSFQYLSDNMIFQVQKIRFFDILKQQVIFSQLKRRVIEDITLKCNYIFCPPDHTIVMEGEEIEHMYILEKGNIEMTSSYRPSGKTLTSGCDFCLMEMLLGTRSHYTYKAISFAIVIIISKQDIDEILLKWHCPLRHNLKTIVDELNETLLPIRIFHASLDFKEHPIRPASKISWKVFSSVKKDESFIDFQRPLTKDYRRRLSKYLLMKRTILPEGKFIKKYELFFSLVLILMAISHPSMLIIMELSHYWIFLYLFFLVIGLVDMYLRMHMAFYNEQGVLVSHPWYTAKNYVKTSFLIECVALVPIDIILHSTSNIFENGDVSSTHIMKLMCAYCKLLYLYRYKGFSYIKSKALHSASVIRVKAITTPLLLVALNTLTMTYIYLNLMIDPDSNLTNKSSWFFDKYASKKMTASELGTLYINSFYWVTMTTLGCLPLHEKTYPWILRETIMILICLLFGYISLMKFLAFCITIYNWTNSTLMSNQLQANEFHEYMKKCRLKRNFIKWIFAHLEYSWNQTHGIQTSLIIEGQSSLRNTCMIQMYSQFFYDTFLFRDYEHVMAKTLGPKFKSTHFLKQEVIVDFNDVVSKLFFVFNGEVLVMNAMYTIQDVLLPGSIFGNIDDCKNTRSMVIYISNTNVVLLEIDTMVYYKCIEKYGDIRFTIKKHIISDNISYIKNERFARNFDFALEVLALTFKRTNITWKNFNIKLLMPARWLLETTSYASAYWAMYLFGFSLNGTWHIVAFYLFDLLFLLKCLIANLDKKYGQFDVKMQSKQVLKWYLRNDFAFDAFAVFPFEMITLVTLDYSWSNLFRLNRFFRIVIFFRFIAEVYSTLKVNILIMHAISCTAEITLFIHTCSCLLYKYACPGGVCRRQSWLLRTGVTCKHHYLCSTFYATSLFTQAGLTTMTPILIEDRLAVAVIALLGRFLMIVTIGQIFMSIKYFKLGCLYYYRYGHIKRFLEFTTITPAMKETVCTYLRHLYTHQRGHQIPILMKQLPSYMQCAVKSLIYGHNIFNNVIFDGCHYDFLRQMMVLSKINTFFPNDVICHAGEINETMYFIHKGNVLVLEISESNVETIIDELSAADAFGVIQGLFKKKPHLYTFKAKGVTIVVMLQKSKWEHLLHFFPACAYFIYSKFSVPN